MQSRMDRYVNNSSLTSRVQRNQSLYEEVKNTSIEDVNVNSEVSVLGRNSNNIDVGNLKKILDDKYSDDTPRRRSISLTPEEMEEKKVVPDTKEYDINVILKKAKEGKDIDYNKERLKSVRQTQYEILNNIDLNSKQEVDSYEEKKKAEEDNLMDLINTITALELKNKNKMDKEVSQALDMFDDLNDSEPEEKEIEKIEFKKDINKKEDIRKEVSPEKMEEAKQEEKNHIEKTLSKIDIDINSYDDFNDIEKGSKSAFILKVMIFLIIILLIIGGIFIVNNMLDLGLFS